VVWGIIIMEKMKPAYLLLPPDTITLAKKMRTTSFPSSSSSSPPPSSSSSSSSSNGIRKSPNKWTKEENQKLSALVAHYGEKKWKRISAEMGGGLKTGAQCAQHWKRVLSPEIRKGHWDEIEEELLLRLVTQYGSCWKKLQKKNTSKNRYSMSISVSQSEAIQRN